MNKLIVLSAASFSHWAHAHDGHGLAGSHWHPTDTLGFLAVLVVVAAGVATGLVAGLSLTEVLALLGTYFVENRFMTLPVLLMLPVVLGYTVFVYWTFRGKLKAGEGYH